jgi:hypothetical protein
MKIRGGFLILFRNERGSPCARIITLFGFNLDHLGPKIGKRLTRPWARKNAGQFDDL